MNKHDDEDIVKYSKAITLNPSYAEGYYQRGLAYNRKNQLNLAHADFKKVVELDPVHENADLVNKMKSLKDKVIPSKLGQKYYILGSKLVDDSSNRCICLFKTDKEGDYSLWNVEFMEDYNMDL